MFPANHFAGMYFKRKKKNCVGMEDFEIVKYFHFDFFNLELAGTCLGGC